MILFPRVEKKRRAIHNFPNPDEEVIVRQDADRKFKRTSR
jgi:hypothetical protein